MLAIVCDKLSNHPKELLEILTTVPGYFPAQEIHGLDAAGSFINRGYFTVTGVLFHWKIPAITRASVYLDSLDTDLVTMH